MNLATARHAADLLAKRLPHVPDGTINDFILRPRTVAPDEATYAHITQLPSGVVHSLWMAGREGRRAA